MFVTDRGRPAHVLLSIDEYTRLTGKQPGIAELLAMPDGDAPDFDPPRLHDGPRRAVRLR